MPTRNLRGSKLSWIRLPDFEAMCFNLARELFSFDQPIPDFVTRSPGVLESCLKTPLQQFGENDVYPTLSRKLAILFYLMIKNHPFQNGNKRIALTAVFVILYMNGKWLKTTPLAVYRMALETAQSNPKEKNRALKRIQSFLKRYMIDLSSSE